MNKSIKSHLKVTLQHIDRPINYIHLQKTCKVAKQEWIKKHKNRIRFGGFLKLQIRFLGWRVWLIQNLFLMTIYTLFESMSKHFLVQNNRYAAFFLSCISVLLLLTAIPFIYRSTKYKLQEIEMASFFSRTKLILANLLIIVIGNLFVLGIVFWLAIEKTSLEAGSILLYVGMPYLTASCGFIYLLGHTSSECFPRKTARFVAILGLAFIIMNRFYDNLFQQSLSSRWLIVCIGLILYIIYQVRYIVLQSPFVNNYYVEG